MQRLVWYPVLFNIYFYYCPVCLGVKPLWKDGTFQEKVVAVDSTLSISRSDEKLHDLHTSEQLEVKSNLSDSMENLGDFDPLHPPQFIDPASTVDHGRDDTHSAHTGSPDREYYTFFVLCWQ